MSRIVIALAVAASFLFLAPAAQAEEDFSPINARGEVTDGRPTAVVVSSPGGDVVATWTARATSGGARWTCHYRPHRTADTPIEIPDPAIDPDADGALIVGQIYTLICVDQAGDLVYQNQITWRPGDPFSGLASVERATDEALAALTVPTPEVAMSPAADVDHLVGLDTWLWLTTWQPASATATIATTSSTVTVIPASVTYSFGDGSPDLTCRGAGVPYVAGATTDCGHRWTRRSTATNVSGTFDVTATVTWQVTWSATNGEAGDLGTLTSSTTSPIRVLEAQAVVDY